MHACSFAKATVLSLCERFKTGQVSINEFKIAHKNEDQILHLFQACSTSDDNKNFVSTAALKNAIRDRKEEFGLFLRQQTFLKHLCRYISDQSQVCGKILFH